MLSNAWPGPAKLYIAMINEFSSWPPGTPWNLIPLYSLLLSNKATTGYLSACIFSSRSLFEPLIAISAFNLSPKLLISSTRSLNSIDFGLDSSTIETNVTSFSILSRIPFNWALKLSFNSLLWPPIGAEFKLSFEAFEGTLLFSVVSSSTSSSLPATMATTSPTKRTWRSPSSIPNLSFSSVTYFSAHVAAIAPSETAVTTCLNTLGLKSPAAYTPGIFVSMFSFVNI